MAGFLQKIRTIGQSVASSDVSRARSTRRGSLFLSDIVKQTGGASSRSPSAVVQQTNLSGHNTKRRAIALVHASARASRSSDIQAAPRRVASGGA